MTGAAKQTAMTSSKLSTAVARQWGWRQRSPGRYRCHESVIRMCEWRAIPPSNCITRCLPFGSTDSTRRPFSRAIACGRASLTTFPPMRCRKAAAVRQTVPPPGKDRPALGPEDDAFGRSAEPGFAQHRFQPRSLDRCAVDTLDLELVHASRDRRQRLQVRGLHLAGGEQRSSAALEIEPQFAALEHNIGAGCS